jgi:hypothetical protein
LLRPLVVSRPCPAASQPPQPPAAAQDQFGLAGPYLAARLAVRDGDHREAAAYFERRPFAPIPVIRF